MPPAHEMPYLRDVIIFLAVAAVIVPIFHRLKVSPVLGYLVAGMAIGPFGFAIIGNHGNVEVLAEFGVVFLLFLIGLELSFERLWTLRRLVFGLGAAQVVVTGAVIGLIAWGWGNSPRASIILGACLALSSTAVVMQIMSERGEIASRLGRTSFAVLLFQDLAVVPILVLVTVLGAGDDSSILQSLGLAAGKAVLAVVAIFALGRLLLRPLFKLVAGTRIPELFVAMTLLTVIGTAWLTGLSGLSMALGAFLAGLLIAETEFRHQVEIDIQPFKGLLLGVFFLSVGMAIDFAAVADRIFWVAASIVGLIALKAAVAGALCWAFGIPRLIALQAGLYLSQAGEFAFVTVGLAVTVGLIPGPVGQFMVIVASLSMVVTPFVMMLARGVGERLFHDEATSRLSPGAEGADIEGHIVIAGFGRVGQTVAKLLGHLKIPYIGLDTDPRRIETCRRLDLPVFYGDARRVEVLDRVGAGHAQAIVVTLDDSAAARRAVGNIRSRWPDLPVYARARDMATAGDLADLGVTQAVPETVESSLQLAGQLLVGLGFPTHTVDDLIDHIRQSEYAWVRPIIERRRDGDT